MPELVRIGQLVSRGKMGAYVPPVPPTYDELKTQLVADLTADGLWSKFGLFYRLAAPDTTYAKINWVAPGTNDLTEVGSLTFTANQGYASDGATGYLNTSRNANTFTATDCSAGFYGITPDAFLFMGTTRVNDILVVGTPPNGPDPSWGLIGAANSFNSNLTEAPGHLVQDRTGTAQTRYLNGSLNASNTATNTAIQANPLWLLRSGGTGYSESGAIMGCAHVGTHLTASQMATLYSRLTTFLTAVGAIA